MATYKVEDIFEDIPGDDKQVMLKIPEELMTQNSWKEGDNIKVSWGDQGTIIIEKVDVPE